MTQPRPESTVYFSLGMMAWNEEDSITRTLESLFEQTLFACLEKQGLRAEIVCLANGCTDRTAAVARAFFERQMREHPHRAAIDARVADLPEPGRNPTWNRFVHELSAPGAAFVGFMDADIVFLQRETLERMMRALEDHPEAAVASDQAHKDLKFKERLKLHERISLHTSDMTGTIEGRFSGQLYVMRSGVARNIYLPRDLGAPDDGFLKAVICSDFLTKPVDPRRVVTPPSAGHVFEAYVTAKEVLNNQKRQMIGQTSVYVLIEYLKTLSLGQRQRLGETIRRLEREDPDWLKALLRGHLRSTRYFWRLFPGLATFRFRRLMRLRGLRKITHLPATLLGFLVTMVASWQAHRFLRRGQTHFWPKASRSGMLTDPRAGQR